MDINTLKDSFSNLQNEDNSGEFKLKESGKDATLKEVTLINIPNDSLIVKMDGVKFDKLFIDKWGFNKHSDYMVITNDKVIFIEMKSKSEFDDKLGEECRKKFTSDKSVMDYADSIFENILSKNSFFRQKEFHYVLLYQSLSINKTPTIKQPNNSNTEPNNFRKIAISNEGVIDYNSII